LGQHVTQVIEEARTSASLERYYATIPKAGDDLGRAVSQWSLFRLIGYTPLRFNRAAVVHLGADWFDRAVARELAGPVGVFVGFVGMSLRSFVRARRLGAARMELHAASGHVDHVTRQDAAARRRHPIESGWLGESQRAKSRKEYEQADVIWVASEYSRRTFIEAGVDEKKLSRIHLRTAARFTPPPAKVNDGVFRAIYVGSLSVGKGVPLLINAFSRLPMREAELTLVGGCSTRRMRKFLEQAVARDPRIRIAPGDPLPQFQKANVCVHPSYQDGWGYAPAEALACGVPVVVSEDTGMKELVREGANGYVVPTGDEDALYERLEFLVRARGHRD
jgi:glycosyltransferase involved in cell wall biosynthesis